MEREDGTNVSYRDYVQECRALASDAVELVAALDYDNASDAVAELVDSHQWSIYYYGHGIIMEHTENRNAALEYGLDLDGNGLGNTTRHWLSVRSRFAVPAFVADVERFLA